MTKEKEYDDYENEPVRCSCGAFASSSPFVNEGSGEMLSCHCSKCGLSWEEPY